MVNCTFTSSHPSLRGAVFSTMECNGENSQEGHSGEHFQLCWLLGTSVLRKRRVFRTDVPRSQHRSRHLPRNPHEGFVTVAQLPRLSYTHFSSFDEEQNKQQGQIPREGELWRTQVRQPASRVS